MSIRSGKLTEMKIPFVRLGTFIAITLFFGPPALAATRTLGSKTTSGFGQDSNSANWLLSATTTTLNGVTVNEQVICTFQSSDGTICNDGEYTFLYQVVPPGPYVITFSHLNGYAYNNNAVSSFGLMGCDTAIPPNNTIALCHDYNQNDLAATSFDFPNGTLSVSVPPASSTYLTFYLQETQNPLGPLIAPKVNINGARITPGLLAFGSQSLAPGYIGLPKLLTLTNTLRDSLALSSLGTYPGFTTSSQCGNSISAGSTCAISVQPNGAKIQNSITATLTFLDSSAVGYESISISSFPSGMVTVYPDTLTFGTTNAPDTNANILHSALVNTNGFGFTIGSVTVSPDPATNKEEFVVENTSTCTASLFLASGTTCTLDIGFPNGTLDNGDLTGTVTVTDADNGKSYTLVLEGFAGTSFTDKSNLAFGNQPVGYLSDPQTVTFTNNSGGTVNIVGVTASSDFTAQSGTCVDPANIVILPNLSSCFVDVRFTPTGNGFRNGTVTIADDVIDGSQVIVTSGRGGPPVLFSPPAFVLGTVPINSGAFHSFTLTNNADTALNITDMSVASGNSSDFHIDFSNPCPKTSTTLEANTSCSIGINFIPTAVGPRKSSISITDDAAGSPHSALLIGVGTASAVSPSVLDFGSQNVGTTSSPLVVSVRNWGANPMNVWEIFLSGSNPSDFSKSTTCGSTLDSGALCSINLTFTPQLSGSRIGTLIVNDDGSASPQKVSLFGTGTGPLVSLSTTALSFPDQAVGTFSGAQAVSISNIGTGPLTISGIAIVGANSTDFIIQSSTCPVSPSKLAVQSSCSFTVVFAPTALGPRKSSASITDNAPASPRTIVLTGKGTKVSSSSSPTSAAASSSTSSGTGHSAVNFSFSRPILRFGPRQIGNASSSQAVTLTNTGSAALMIEKIQISGLNHADFAQTNNCGESLAPRTSCTLQVTFVPHRLGLQTAIISIPGVPSPTGEVRVIGIGVSPKEEERKQQTEARMAAHH